MTPENKKRGKANDVDKLVADAVYKRRRLLGLTQVDIANALGITYQQFQKYEAGHDRISASRLWGLSRVLKMPVAHFFKEVQ